MTIGRGCRAASLIAALVALLASQPAIAQEEIPPSSGKGRLVVVLSGATGAGNYRVVANRIAALGYDVALFDSNTINAAKKGRPLSAALTDAVALARQLPHALPGKIGMVGFSLGGGMVLGYGSAWSNDVAVVAAWYPSTREIKDVPAFVRRITVPVVMFAGTADEYRFCCMIDKAREIDAAAKAARAPFELTTYSGVGHGFSIPGGSYDAGSTEDALARTATALKRHLGN